MQHLQESNYSEVLTKFGHNAAHSGIKYKHTRITALPKNKASSHKDNSTMDKW